MDERRKVPKLRFPGFTDDWEQRKLVALCENITVGIANSATHAYTDNGVVMFRNQNIKENYLDDSDLVYIDDDFEKKYKNKRLKKNDLLVARTGYPGTACVVPEKYEGAQTFTTLIARLKNGINPHYISQYINSDYGKKYFLSTQIGGGQKNSGAGILEELPMKLPPTIEEQNRIADYLGNIDNLITLHQRKLEHTKDLKKSLLQKMFPKNGEKYPEIRFPGFTDDWEQRKLGDMVSFSKGTGYSKSDLQSEGTPIILYGRLYTNYETIISDVDTFVEEKPNSVFSKGREVIVPASGETAEDIAVASVVEKEGVLLGSDLNIITPTADLDSAFLALSISNGKPHNDMAKMAQGKSVVHLHNSDLAKIDLPYPSYEEQCKISNQFTNLDNLITLHQRELTHLQLLKKGLLQQMFI